MTNLFKNHFIAIVLFSFVAIILVACGDSSSSKASSETPASPDGVGQYNAQNVKVEATPSAEVIAQGETIFKASCSPCHKLDDQRLVGPGLKGITKLRTTAWIFNMITNPTEMNAKDPEAKKLLETYMTPMAPIALSEQELVAVYAFLQKNDA